MVDALTGAFNKPFKEAVAAFRLRLGNLVPTAKWDDIWQEQHDRAFMVAGAMKADLLADLAAAVDKAISQGTSLEEFRRDFRRIVEERGWHGWTGEGTKAGEAWRTRVIYRTNMRTSYAAGRMAQLVEGKFPLWIYRHGGSVEPRIIHLGWNGLVLPPDHPFWATHAPPNGWGCSCYIVGAYSFKIAQKLGGQPGKKLPDGWQKLDPKTGAPVGIDRGWAYAPGRTVADDIIAAVKAKVDQLPRQIGADLGKDVSTARGRSGSAAVALDAAAAEAVASGVARSVVLRPTLPVQPTQTFLQAAAEIVRRFALPPLEVFAHGDDLPARLRGSRKAAAFYVPAKRWMGVRAAALSPSGLRREAEAGMHPGRQADWARLLGEAEPAVQQLARQMEGFGWSVIDDVAGVARHEFGHHLHFTYRREIDDLVFGSGMLRQKWWLLISEYSGMMPEEFIAESFALYMAGDERQFYRLHPDLLAWFRQKDRRT